MSYEKYINLSTASMFADAIFRRRPIVACVNDVFMLTGSFAILRCLLSALFQFSSKLSNGALKMIYSA